MKREIPPEEPELDERVILELNRQMQAAQASLREYVDGQLARHGEGSRPKERGAAAAASSAPRGFAGWLRELRPELYLLLAALAAWHFGVFDRTARPPAPPDEEAVAVEEAPPQVPESPATSPSAPLAPRALVGKELPQLPPEWTWPAAWQSLRQAKNRQVAALCRQLAEGSVPVSDGQKARFTGFAGALEKGEDVAEASLLRKGLFEFLVLRHGAAPPASGQVDLDLSDLKAAAVQGLLTELGLREEFSDPKLEDETLQAAVVVTAILRQPATGDAEKVSGEGGAP